MERTRACFALAALLVLGTAVRAQDEPPPDPELPQKLKDLKEMVRDRRAQHDPAAAGLLLVLTERYGKLNGKDQDKLCDAVGACLFDGRRRPPDAAVLYHSAAEALGKMGADGARHLRRALEASRFDDREWVPLRVTMLEALGQTKDEKQVDYLLEQARRSPENQVMAAAGAALGHFTELELRPRREVVKDLIRRWGELEAKGSQLDPTPTQGGAVDFSGQNARDTLAQIRPKWTATLRKLTGRSFRDHPEWQRWLNKEPDWEPVRAGG